jgi:hypothetical protein
MNKGHRRGSQNPDASVPVMGISAKADSDLARGLWKRHNKFSHRATFAAPTAIARRINRFIQGRLPLLNRIQKRLGVIGRHPQYTRPELSYVRFSTNYLESLYSGTLGHVTHGETATRLSHTYRNETPEPVRPPLSGVPFAAAQDGQKGIMSRARKIQGSIGRPFTMDRGARLPEQPLPGKISDGTVPAILRKPTEGGRSSGRQSASLPSSPGKAPIRITTKEISGTTKRSIQTDRGRQSVQQSRPLAPERQKASLPLDLAHHEHPEPSENSITGIRGTLTSQDMPGPPSGGAPTDVVLRKRVEAGSPSAGRPANPPLSPGKPQLQVTTKVFPGTAKRSIQSSNAKQNVQDSGPSGSDRQNAAVLPVFAHHRGPDFSEIPITGVGDPHSAQRDVSRNGVRPALETETAGFRRIVKPENLGEAILQQSMDSTMTQFSPAVKSGGSDGHGMSPSAGSPTDVPGPLANGALTKTPNRPTAGMVVERAGDNSRPGLMSDHEHGLRRPGEKFFSSSSANGSHIKIFETGLGPSLIRRYLHEPMFHQSATSMQRPKNILSDAPGASEKFITVPYLEGVDGETSAIGHGLLQRYTGSKEAEPVTHIQRGGPSIEGDVLSQKLTPGTDLFAFSGRHPWNPFPLRRKAATVPGISFQPLIFRKVSFGSGTLRAGNHTATSSGSAAGYGQLPLPSSISTAQPVVQMQRGQTVTSTASTGTGMTGLGESESGEALHRGPAESAPLESNVDNMVEKVLRKVMRRLALEIERRGI